MMPRRQPWKVAVDAQQSDCQLSLELFESACPHRLTEQLSQRVGIRNLVQSPCEPIGNPFKSGLKDLNYGSPCIPHLALFKPLFEPLFKPPLHAPSLKPAKISHLLALLKLRQLVLILDLKAVLCP
jgi:hypothetical protein